jgi:hypothetical protein
MNNTISLDDRIATALKDGEHLGELIAATCVAIDKTAPFNSVVPKTSA